ncbi:MAG: phage major capsid protein [Hyphomicrobiaceae bacterium]
MLKDQQIEVKASVDINAQYDDLMRAFEQFKETNDERLGEVERKTGADVVTTDRLQRIEDAMDGHRRALDEMTLKAQRPQLGGSARSGASLQHKAAFDGYIRTGEIRTLRSLEEKALSVGSSADGGYTVPPEVEAGINRAVRTLSPIRGISGVRQVSSNVYNKPFMISGPATGWVGETAARPETAGPQLASLAFPTMELYAMPSATQALLDDSAVNIDQWIADEVRIAFADQEGTAFVTGDGVNKPKGFLGYTKVANASWTWGNSGYLATGVAGGFPAATPTDKLIDLTFAVKAGYRANGTFTMNRATQGAIRKFKDSNGNYIWQPPSKAGEMPLLLGYPVAECEDMPNIATDSFSVAFGDFERGYLIVDRVGVRILRDPYSAKPYVLFYTTKRVGGGIQDFDAIKLLKFGLV